MTPKQKDRVIAAQVRYQQRKLVRRLNPRSREEAIALLKLPIAELLRRAHPELQVAVANA